MATDICYFVQSQGAENLMDLLDMTCGAIPPGNYGQVVDQSAPTQFLEFYSHIAEHRFAFAVTQALKFNPGFLTAIQNYCGQKGFSLKPEKLKTLEAAYEVINMTILDGMPEEDTKNIISVEANKLVWEKIKDTHQPYWEKTDGDINLYYNLQECFIQGLLQDSGISFTNQENKIFTLSA